MSNRGQIRGLFVIHSIETNIVDRLTQETRRRLELCSAYCKAENLIKLSWLFELGPKGSMRVLESDDTLALALLTNHKNFNVSDLEQFVKLLRVHFPHISGSVELETEPEPVKHRSFRLTPDGRFYPIADFYDVLGYGVYGPLTLKHYNEDKERSCAAGVLSDYRRMRLIANQSIK